MKITDLSISFGKHLVLDSVTADFATGSISGIIGFNGSGKTTLFNAILGQIKPDSGEISVQSPPINKQVAFLPTQNFFYSYLTGKEYLDIFPQHISADTIEALIKLFNLPLNQLVEDYSSGMKKKLALLATLKLNRTIYLLDEPFNGLDLESVFVVKKIIEVLKSEGKTVLITSHIPETLADLCDSFYLLREGKLQMMDASTYSSTVKDEFHQTFGSKVRERLRFPNQ